MGVGAEEDWASAVARRREVRVKKERHLRLKTGMLMVGYVVCEEWDSRMKKRDLKFVLRVGLFSLLIVVLVSVPHRRMLSPLLLRSIEALLSQNVDLSSSRLYGVSYTSHQRIHRPNPGYTNPSPEQDRGLGLDLGGTSRGAGWSWV